jgi:hypothetical protein
LQQKQKANEPWAEFLAHVKPVLSATKFNI